MRGNLAFCVKWIWVGLLFVAVEHGWAQVLVPASPPVGAFDGDRFLNIHEDWTTPALKKGDLQPAPALVSIFEENAEHVVQLIRVQWRAGDPIDLYVIRPKGVAKPPVIVWLYGFPAETDLFKDETFHKLVTKGGFAAVGFMTALTGHRFHDRPMSSWFVSELQEALSTSAHDVQMVLDYLAARDDFDLSRVGLFGQGSGGSIGILAAAVDPRIKVLDTLDPWGDWPDWLAKTSLIEEGERGSYTTPEFLQKVAPLDPVIWLPRVQSRKFRLQDAVFNRVTPGVCKEKLKSVIPRGGATVRYETASELQGVADGSILDWIKRELNNVSAVE